ncbi:SPOR domain-containing protein [Streptomyces sp. NPDC058045]|uniref:SPOR domain-containing protein n=1 Tax=Streptomyces sp. NPDC058045 TaxID=3346311 RepID=UPI0036E556CD
MSESTAPLVWHVIRQDGSGYRYRVSSYATRAEAQRIADSLDAAAGARLYRVEHVTAAGSR